MSNDKHKTFKEATKLTGMSRVGLENKFEGIVQNIEDKWSVLRIGVNWKPDDN